MPCGLSKALTDSHMAKKKGKKGKVVRGNPYAVAKGGK